MFSTIFRSRNALPRRLPALLCLSLGLCLGLFSTACGGPAITEQSFAGRCLMYSVDMGDNGCSCGPQPQICDQFKEVVYADYAGRQACIDACTSLKGQLYQQYVLGCCRFSIRYAWQNCNNYCRANYPE